MDAVDADLFPAVTYTGGLYTAHLERGAVAWFEDAQSID
jgi:hypothetical protein